MVGVGTTFFRTVDDDNDRKHVARPVGRLPHLGVCNLVGRDHKTRRQPSSDQSSTPTSTQRETGYPTILHRLFVCLCASPALPIPAPTTIWVSIPSTVPSFSWLSSILTAAHSSHTSFHS